MHPDRPPTSLLKGASLFLDFDGTLVELAPSPDEIEVRPEVPAIIRHLQVVLQGRLAVLSGRAVADVAPRLAPVRVNIGGSHGAERHLATGQSEAIAHPDGLDEAAQAFLQVQADHPGVLVEQKPTGIALHFRTAPAAEAACLAVAHKVAASTGLAVQTGKMVIELKHPEANKGKALKTFMQEPPFIGTTPIAIGDDRTDEDAFFAARELGGAGILVGVARNTAAAYRLDDVTDVHRWLQEACAEAA